MERVANLTGAREAASAQLAREADLRCRRLFAEPLLEGRRRSRTRRPSSPRGTRCRRNAGTPDRPSSPRRIGLRAPGDSRPRDTGRGSARRTRARRHVGGRGVGAAGFSAWYMVDAVVLVDLGLRQRLVHQVLGVDVLQDDTVAPVPAALTSSIASCTCRSSSGAGPTPSR